jgi:hypothetical protein
MFLRYYCELAQGFEATADRLLEAPESWLPVLASSASARGELLMAEVGFGLAGRRVGKQVRIRLGVAMRSPGRLVLPLTWLATGPSSLFPAFEGELEVGALGSGWSQLVISVNYLPPLGAVGKTFDRLALHRVAEATIKDFLDRAGARLMGGEQAQADRGRLRPRRNSRKRAAASP